MSDIYDEEIAYLKELVKIKPDAIEKQWYEAQCSPLFSFLTSTRSADGICGCPTMVKAGTRTTPDRKLTKFVCQQDIPDYVEDITIDHLETFAKIQRKADELLGRDTPITYYTKGENE